VKGRDVMNLFLLCLFFISDETPTAAFDDMANFYSAALSRRLSSQLASHSSIPNAR
jgi:hypothetical protein